MSAYFSIEIEFDPTQIKDSFVQQFFDSLARNGVTYLRGCRKSEGYTLEQQIMKNQNYISNPGSMDGSMNQTQFQFLDFTEVRGYWEANWERVIFRLIIPEAQFYEYTLEKGEIRHEDKMKAVKELCTRIWQPPVKCIQTAWECSDCPPEYDKISPHNPPQTEPFSIVPLSKYSKQWNMEARNIGNEGVLLEKKENWFWT